jgi:hypothetical protein
MENNEEGIAFAVERKELGLADEYTAFKQFEYKPVIYQVQYEQSWIDLVSSYYRGSHALIEGVVKGALFRDVEGVAGVFLFRHFLELILKEIVLWGRMLETEDQNAAWEEVKKVGNVHGLAVIWKWVVADAKRKIKTETWESFDIPFIEKMIAEFDAVDPKGFTFRYHGQGGEHCAFNYELFFEEMDHARQVLEGILGCLRLAFGRNADYEEMLRQEAANDLFG